MKRSKFWIPACGLLALVLGCGGKSSCKAATDCTGGQICIGGACVACTGDTQCPSGQSCVSGACSASGTCTATSQCSGGLVCVGGQCKPCSDGTQCPTGQFCNTGMCSTMCLTSSQCPGGQICMGGACVAGCTNTSQCTGGQVCTASGTCGPCTNSNQCGLMEICQGGACVMSCTNSGQCMGGQVCTANLICGPCSSTTQCPNGQTCTLAQLCQLVPTGTSIAIDGGVGTNPIYVGKQIGLALAATGATKMSIALQGGNAAFVTYATGAVLPYTGADGPISVCATFQGSNGLNADPVCTPATADVTPPSVPAPTLTNLARTTTASWPASADSASGVGGYKVYYGTSAAYGGTEAAQGPSPVATSALSQTLSALTFGGVGFHVAVSAVDKVGNESALSTDQLFTTGAPWTWVTPTWGPGDGIDLQCLDVNTCWVLSESATTGTGQGNGLAASYPANRGGLSKTTNGGTTWSLLDYGSGQPPLVLRMRDANVGLLATTELGRVRRTQDGGKTWQVVSLISDAGMPGHVDDIRWVDPANRPNVVMLYVSAPGAPGDIWVSNDAGLTFIDQGTITGGSPDLAFLFVQTPAANAEQVLLSPPAANNVYGNVDAGHFVKFATALPNQAIWDGAFLTPTNGILVGQNAAAFTFQAGAWTAATTTACASGSTAFYHLTYPASGGGAAFLAGGGVACSSNNSGQTWTSLPLSYSKGASTNGEFINALAFVDATHGFIEVADNGAPTLLSTANGGTSWTRLQPDFLSARVGSALNGVMAWFDENHGYLGDNGSTSGLPGAFYSTANAGQSWTDLTTALVASCPQTTGFLFPFSAASGLAWSPGVLCSTVTAGAMWTPGAGATSANLNGLAGAWSIAAVAWPDANDVFVVGGAPGGMPPKATAAFSTNGGTSFTQLGTVQSVDFTAVARTTPSAVGTPVLFAGSTGLGLYRSLSAGASWGAWTAIPAPNNIAGWAGGGSGNLDFVLFPSGRDTGYLVSKTHADVLKTLNGGVAWTQVAVDAGGMPLIPAPIQSVACEDDTHCTAVDSSSELWVTADGFQTVVGVSLNAAGLPSNAHQIQVLPNGLQFLSANQAVVKTHTRWQ